MGLLVALALVLNPTMAPAAEKAASPSAAKGSGAAASGGDSAFTDASAAARDSSNPLGGNFLIILNQFDNYFLEGNATNKARSLNTWSLQPVIPIPMKKLGEHWIWVNRPTFPFIINSDVPDVPGIRERLISGGGGTPSFPPNIPPGNLPFTSKGGFGDIVYFSLLGQSIPTKKWGGGDFVWAVGPTFQFPTASHPALGSGKWSMGPSAVMAFIGNKFILGALGQQWFDYANSGSATSGPVNFTWVNFFYFINFPKGWQVGGTPIVTANWATDAKNRWTVPLGLGVYKTHIFFGKMPIKMGVEFQWSATRPDILGQQWNIRFTFAPVLPSPFAKKK